jgi:hypothetical protein
MGQDYIEHSEQGCKCPQNSLGAKRRGARFDANDTFLVKTGHQLIDTSYSTSTTHCVVMDNVFYTQNLSLPSL